MTQKRLEQLQYDEAALLAVWRTRGNEKHAQYRFFNEDGIVDFERWAALPDGKRILVLLKETNGLQSSLTDFLRHGGNSTYWRTWNNVARWTNLILHGTYWEFIPKEALDDAMHDLAVVNLKKYAGGARANQREVAAEAAKDVDLLRQQITLYAPDIVLTCGWGLVSDFLHDTIYQDPAIWNPPDSAAELWYYETTKITPAHSTLVVSMPHPNRAAKRWTLELEKLLRKTNRI